MMAANCAMLDALAQEPYEHRGILHSEMALILHTCQRLGVEVVIESGRARGQSTAMLAKFLPDVEIHSVELRDGPDQDFGIARVMSFPNVTLHWGDGRTELPRLARELSPKHIAVLCDGPKGAAAVSVIQECFQFPHVVAGFIHDMRKLDHGQPSPHRAAALAAFPRAKFSDEDGLVRSSAWLDANVVAANGPCGPDHERQFGSYGPTVGVFLNPILTSKQHQSEELSHDHP